MATKEQIWTAADAISAKGESPTLAAVRAHMGGGSYTDISAAMKGWRATKQTSAAPIREPIPAAIADRLSIFGGELWAAALELANSRLQSEREALEQARQEAEETRNEAAALADSLAADLDKAQADLATQTERLAACFAKEQQQQAVIDQASAAAIENRHRAELAEAARDEIKARADQISGLLKDEQAAHAATKEQQQAALDQARTETKAAAKQLTQTQKEAENARVSEQACQSRLEAAAREIDALKAQVKEERQAAKTAAETAAELKGRLAAFQELKKAEPAEAKAATKKTTRGRTDAKETPST